MLPQPKGDHLVARFYFLETACLYFLETERRWILPDDDTLTVVKDMLVELRQDILARRDAYTQAGGRDTDHFTDQINALIEFHKRLDALSDSLTKREHHPSTTQG
jgi:hypothetical protein